MPLIAKILFLFLFHESEHDFDVHFSKREFHTKNPISCAL